MCIRDSSNIALKGQDFKETHVLSFTSSSSESLAELRSSLSGNEWDLYIAEIQKHISSARVSSGKSLGIYNQDIDYPMAIADREYKILCAEDGDSSTNYNNSYFGGKGIWGGYGAH